MKESRIVILAQRLQHLDRLYHTVTPKQLNRFYRLQSAVENEFHALAGEFLSQGNSLAHLL